MSLATLLAAGKSLVGVKNDDSPYRLTQEAYLPKFTLDTGTRRTVATTRGETFAGGLGATESSEATARTPQEPIANGAKEAEIAKSKEIPERRASGGDDGRRVQGLSSSRRGRRAEGTPVCHPA